MDHSPQAGQGGNPLSLGATLGPERGFFFLGIYHPLFGFLTFGILFLAPDKQRSLETLLDR